jgi:hypothetical protein
MGTRITTGRRDSQRFKTVIFMHPCIYINIATLSCIIFVALDYMQFLIQKKITIDEKCGN